MKTKILLLAAFLPALCLTIKAQSNRVVFAQWNFNSAVPDANVATGTNGPSIGSGTAALIGGVTATFAAGDTAADPAGTNDNSGWNTATYPAQGASNKTAGVRFTVSTAGWQDIMVSWSERVSPTASKYVRLQYTTNGAAYVDFSTANSMATTNTFLSQSDDLAAITTANNNPSFGFRIVSELESTAIGTSNANYVTAGSSGYSTSGSIRYDMVTLSGTTYQPLVVNCSTNKTVSCSNSWSFDQPAVSTTCSNTNVTVTIVSTVTNGTCPQVVTRTWEATDFCGHSNTCSQVVTVLDTSPPVMTCTPDKTVTCADSWTFDQPSAYDACAGTNTGVAILSTFTNGVCQQVATRIWLAYNACGSASATCTQVVTVVPLVPTLLCSNVTITCGSPIPTNPPPVTDACCSNVVVSLINSTTTNSGCTPTIYQTWQAVEQCCGGSNTCVRVISVVDTTPPVITCASNKTVIAGSPWSFDPPSAFDACCGTNVTVQLISTNATAISPCETLWTGVWQASDCCSNTITCTQTVTVLPPIISRTNIWQIGAGGSWGDSNNWSQGLPQPGDFLLITNAGSKTITNDATVSPCYQTVSYLTIGSPGGVGSNVLVLLSGPTNPPLHVLHDFTLADGGAIDISNSLFQVDGLTIVPGFKLDSGVAQLASFALLSASNTVSQANLGGGALSVLGNFTFGSGAIGSTGLVSVTGGTHFIGGVFGIANDGTLTHGSGFGSATFADTSVHAGAVKVGSLAGGLGSLTLQSNAFLTVDSDFTLVSSSLVTTSAVTLNGGSLVVSNGTMGVGPAGVGRFTITGGSHIIRDLTLGGTNSSGSFYGLGGHLKILGTLRPNFTLGGGIDIDGSGGSIIIGDRANAGLVMGAGAVTNFLNMTVGYSPGLTGMFTQTGGVTHVTNNLIVGNVSGDCSVGPWGNVALSGGFLYVTNAGGTAVLEVRNGPFVMTGGTLVVDTLNLNNPCGQFSYSGGNLHFNQIVLPPGTPALALTITVDSLASTVTLSWPLAYAGYGYFLQEMSEPSRPGWTTVHQPPIDIGSTRTVTLPLNTTANQFYRVSKP